MLSYNDQIIREAHNEQICKNLLTVSKQDQAMKAAFKQAKKKNAARSAVTDRGSPKVMRFAYATLIALLTVLLAAQIAVAASQYFGSGGGLDLILFH